MHHHTKASQILEAAKRLEEHLQDEANNLGSMVKDAGDDDRAGNAGLCVLFSVLRAKADLLKSISVAAEVAK